MDRGHGTRQARQVRRCPSATTPEPQTGVVVARIAAAYESRFTDYVRVATAIAGDRERGRDAVQDAFARAIAGCLAYRGDGPLEAWLWRAVTNAAHNQRRAQRALVPAASIEHELTRSRRPRAMATTRCAGTWPPSPSASASCSSCATTRISPTARSERC